MRTRRAEPARPTEGETNDRITKYITVIKLMKLFRQLQ